MCKAFTNLIIFLSISPFILFNFGCNLKSFENKNNPFIKKSPFVSPKKMPLAKDDYQRDLPLKSKQKKNNNTIIINDMSFNKNINNNSNFSNNIYYKEFIPQENQMCFYQNNTQRTGASKINFASHNLKLSWSYKLSDHTFSYNQNTNIWSRSFATLIINSKNTNDFARIYVGAYDKKLHCINSQNGKNIWKFTSGGEIIHCPCTGFIENVPIVWFTSSDRTLYALNADSGEKIWSYEVREWTSTTLPATGSSPVLLYINNIPVIFTTFHLIDNNPFNRLESSQLFAHNALTGELIWARKVSTTPLSSPTLIINKKNMPEKKISILDARLALADTSGVIWFFDPATGDELSKYTCDYFIHSDLSYSKSLKTLYFGSRFGIISGIDPFTMKLKFSFRAGHYVDSTPALLTHGDKKYIFAGSYDRSIYCLDAEISNRIIWRFPTDYHIFSSFQCAFFNNEPALLAPGFDRNIYLLDVKTGKKLWKYRHKELLWPYIKRGDALFSSAGVFHSRNNKEPMLIYPAFDGFLYCFQ